MKIGIIGGSGVYDPGMLTNIKKVKLHTPYGATSEIITSGKFENIDAFFISRHGANHEINPTNVNYRANIWALKELGVTHILAPSAVGSLKEEYKPGDMVFTDQFIDKTTKRISTFYETGQVAHVGIAEPTCPEMRNLLSKEAKKLGIPFHKSGTCVTIEGPRFSTKAESKMFRLLGGDIIGMTMVPECVLAREAEMCYATIAMVTDYDVWKEGEEVSNKKVLATMKKNVENIKRILKAVIPEIAKLERKCFCKNAMKEAFM
ncbi:MAG: S-methyl-5'-thioadenosine phosphorylase [Nanoarchaeota archaeon]|nr:S-methyl-5'-thioadenosine phosphorylase [Nanoarchaeota archaeon]MBU1029982.1 S-methyl-5'-thioadenosine phosphorylase [Nanoarchaeota archaeon]MBU1849247.1 S-methyl-5'-thioadenosine phosphorylase [Nanoarchaeota archaeon]